MRLHYHHVLYTKAVWRSQEATRTLRHVRWLKPPLDDEAHHQIHRAIAVVPVLDHYSASRVLREFEPVEGEYMASIIRLIKAVQSAGRNPKAGIIERQACGLTIIALQMQLPYIKEGLISV